MQHQYVALDFPTTFEVPTDAVANAIAAQTLGMAGRAIYQLINECSGSDQLDEFGCLRWRGYWRSASASPMAGRHIFSPCATSVPREKTIKKASNQASSCERGRRQMSRSEASMLHVTQGEKMNNSPSQQHLLDCSTLSATDLRRRYSAEANTHRNMLQRAPSRGNIIHPDFQTFRDFLAHVGPRLCLRATLDRIDNSDLEYAPGKVRWADKRTQNSNKGDTLLFHCSRTKDAYTASQLAKRQGVSPSSIRKRLERGWTDDEIIEGKRHVAQVNIEHSPRVSSPYDRNHEYLRLERPRTGAEIKWQENAAYAARHREVEGEEYCLCDFETLKVDAAQFGMQLRMEVYEKKFAKWWAEWKPHLKWKKLPEWAQELTAKLEGTTSTEIKRRHAKLRDLL